ncbi:lipoyl synthase [Geomonas azotofigens]
MTRRFTAVFQDLFDYRIRETSRYPKWLRVAGARNDDGSGVHSLVRGLGLETVCQSAKCPNIGECYGRGTATFLILGRHCTRNCGFCAVPHGVPEPPDASEPERVATAVARMSLAHAVITSVTRDDLADGGARHYVKTIRAIGRLSPRTAVEVLVPDFNGDGNSVAEVCHAKPEVFNHNLETVNRLSPLVRPQGDYQRSLRVLKQANRSGLATKSGLMLGLGETAQEVREALADLVQAGCDRLTLGQYLAPSSSHYPVVRHVRPDEFGEWAEVAREMGFSSVASAPLVRSSYHAERFFQERPPAAGKG